MANVLAVNNYPSAERFDTLRRCVQECGAEVSSIGWAESRPSKYRAFDGVVLSGSPDMLSKPATQRKFRDEIETVRSSDVPILGVCFGHQLIAHAFGSRIIEDTEHVLKFVNTEVLVEDSLFQGLPRPLTLLESRHEVVESLPVGFELLARSETSPIAGIKHSNRSLYGVQFHPERYSTENPDGKGVISNFVRLLK